jgi:hypothetical protein
MRTCSVEGCERPHYARGWCAPHYQRWKKDGDLREQVPLRGISNGRCSVPGCGRPHLARGWCVSHYDRWRRGVDVLRPIRVRDDAARWWSKVQRGSDEECWMWLGPPKSDGYGHFTWYEEGRQRQTNAHRYGYQLLVGPVADDFDVDHRCRTRLLRQSGSSRAGSPCREYSAKERGDGMGGPILRVR